MEIASSNNNAVIQQQTLQYSQADGKQSKSSSSNVQAGTPQASLQAPAQEGVAPSSTVSGSSRVGGSIDTYA